MDSSNIKEAVIFVEYPAGYEDKLWKWEKKIEDMRLAGASPQVVQEQMKSLRRWMARKSTHFRYRVEPCQNKF